MSAMDDRVLALAGLAQALRECIAVQPTAKRPSGRRLPGRIPQQVVAKFGCLLHLELLEARQLPDRMLLGGTPVQDEGIDPAELLEAIGGGQLAMHLQPIYDVRQRKVVGAEALARWHHPTKGEISPGVFVRVAETSGMISQLTRWSANACLQVVAEAREAGLSLPVSMNLSATAFAESRVASCGHSSPAGVQPSMCQKNVPLR